MITPISPRFLKQEARKLKKSSGLLMSKALDEVSKKYNFSNYKHYLNVYESNLKQSQSKKEILLKYIASEQKMPRRTQLAVAFIQGVKPPFREVLDILKQFSHSEKAIQSICEQLNLMNNEIQKFLFNSFLTEEGQYEINFRAPNFIAKGISTNKLTYEMNNDMLCVDGNYILKTEFDFEVDDSIGKDERFKDREFDGCFGVEIDKNKKINFVHSDMTMDNGLTPMRGFTEEEMKEYYTHFPDEYGQFDDIFVLNNSIYSKVKRCLSNNEPLTGEASALVLSLVDSNGNDEYSRFVRNIGVKIKAGQPLDEYEHHMLVDVLMLHAQLE